MQANRILFSPGIYEHAAAFIGDLPSKVSRVPLSLARQLPLGSIGTGVVPFDARPDLALKLRNHIYQQTS